MTTYNVVQFTVGDYTYNNTKNEDRGDRTDNGVIGEPTDKTKTSYATIPKNVTYNGVTYDVVAMSFMNCTNMTSAPACNAIFRDRALHQYTPVQNFGGLDAAFKGCSSLVDISALANWNVANTEHIIQLFSECTNLKDISPIQNWCVNSPKRTSYAFEGCSSLVDISALANWKVSRNISEMFYNCKSLSDISALANWDVSQVTAIWSFLAGTAITNVDALANWDLSGIDYTAGNTGAWFSRCTELTDISALANWDVSHFKNLDSIFNGCKSLTDISAVANWDTSNCIDISHAFAGTAITNVDALANWNTSNCTSLGGMGSIFSGCSNLTDISALANWNVSNTVSIRHIFRLCTSLTDVSALANWDTSNCKEMYSVFYGCTSLTDVSSLNWDYTSATDIHAIFQNCTSLSGNINVKNTSANLNSADMFSGTTNNIYIINKDQNPNNIKAYWQDVASLYLNVHYEADDNTVPSLSYNVIRVGAMNSETQVENGEYAYINATAVLFNDYLPTGWSVALGDKTLKFDTVTQTPIWTDTNVGYVYTLKCWQPLGDTAKHVFTLQVSDNITDESDALKANHLSAIVAKTLSKAYKLIDYYHESDPNDPNYDTEGMAVGKFATEANLFDVDMPARFRGNVQFDGSVNLTPAKVGIHTSTSAPTSADGNDGDVWLVYTS